MPVRPAGYNEPNNQLNLAAFTAPPVGRIGNLGRNVLYGPGAVNFDFSLFKTFHITERHSVEFRAETFNIFNTPQFWKSERQHHGSRVFRQESQHDYHFKRVRDQPPDAVRLEVYVLNFRGCLSARRKDSSSGKTIMLRYVFLIAASALTAAAQTPSKYELPAEQRTGSIKRILVLPHSHLDIGFTLPPDQVARDYKDNIDAAIRLAGENADFRWTIESSWMLAEWLRRTTDERQIEALGRLLREGRFALGAAFANMHSGLIGEEEMNRLVYLGESFRRRFRIPAEVAYQNDVPGFSWAYPRVFAGSGVKYLVTGLNLFIGGGNDFGVRNTPFSWVGPDGSKVLTWFTYDSYMEGYRWNVTSRASLDEMEKTVPRRLAWLEKNGYQYDTYLLMASVGDNADPMHAYRTLTKIRAWNRRHPELPMQMCTAEEFFHYIIGKYGNKFKEAAGDATGHWEPVKLGAPEVAARMRETSSLLPAAEALATVDTLLNGSPYPRGIWPMRGESC